ncbi:MAG: sulfurtransferase [Cyanobacteria bacterium J06555_3]
MNRTEYLVDREWLRQELNNPQVVIVDCRFQLANPGWGEQVYQQSHIQGAYYLNLDRDLASAVERHGGRHPLPNPKLLGAKLAQMGIVQNETLVVAYDDSRFAYASRLWWLLRYLGHDQVVLLNGGWNGWLESDLPVSDIIPDRQTGHFVAQPHSDWLVDLGTVQLAQNRDEVIIVDSRDRDRYLGQREPIDPIAGSIPGAVNSPWKQVSNEAGYLQSLAVQKQLWSDYLEAGEIIVYCGSGVTACVNLLSLSMTGYKNTKLYPGGWSDWCSYLATT